jgi:nucleoside 2-deoxyribosyltransferase
MYKIYIAGAITNNPNYVKEFLQAEEDLEKKGFKVLSPLRTQASENALPPKFFFFDCLDLLKQADMICFINDISQSKGAKIERDIANYCGIPVVNYELLREGEYGNRD